MIDVVVDLNCRTRGNMTFAGYEDIIPRGTRPQTWTAVRAVEIEEQIWAPAVVVQMDDEKQLIYLAVAWREFADLPEPVEQEA